MTKEYQGILTIPTFVIGNDANDDCLKIHTIIYDIDVCAKFQRETKAYRKK